MSLNYFKTNDALLPKSVRFAARRIKSLADSVGTLLAVSVVFLAGQLTVSPENSPITFEQALGQVQSLSVEGDKEIPTIVVEDADVEVTYKRLGDDWKQISDNEGVITVNDVASSVQDQLESVYVNDRAEIAPAVGQPIQVATWLPRLK